MIRRYKETDLDKVVDIWYQASTMAHPFLKPEFVEKVKNDMREIYIPNSLTWVFEENNKVVGFVGMLGNEIGGLFILPDQQAKGMGTQLVNYVSKLHNEIEVEVFKANHIGRAFYDKYGFKTFKESIHEETGQAVLRMKFNN